MTATIAVVSGLVGWLAGLACGGWVAHRKYARVTLLPQADPTIGMTLLRTDRVSGGLSIGPTETILEPKN